MSKRKAKDDDITVGSSGTDLSIPTISHTMGSDAGWNEAIDAAAQRIHELSGACSVQTAFFLKDEVLKLKR